jgi:hypothetical protein
MNPARRNVHDNMRDLGLGALAHANWHVNYAHENRWTPELAVLQAAHAGELLIKARVAQEHPLLIFDKLPRQSHASDGHLDFRDLFENGRTVDYPELPALLWAATGIEVPNRRYYESFGRLRNAIQHFAPSETDVCAETRQFIYGVIDPFINRCWDLFAVDYNEDDEPYIHMMGALIRSEVPFLVSPGAAAEFDHCKDDLNETRPTYRKQMTARARRASKAHS